MDVEGYLERIGVTEVEGPSLETLRAVHRGHAYCIPYENLDVYSGEPVDQDIARIYDKIVVRGRGGWCYEMNGLLGWALAELGFKVTRQIAGVMRSVFGDDAYGNHLMLKVVLNGEPWIADVGLGDGLAGPLLLREGETTHVENVGGSRTYRLECLDEQQWRFHNTADAGPPNFDFIFRNEETGYTSNNDDEAKLKAMGQKLQDDPESMFRLNLVALRMTEAGSLLLQGRVFTKAGQRRLLQSRDELASVLHEELLTSAEVTDRIWQQVVDRHTTLFGDTPVEDIRFGPP